MTNETDTIEAKIKSFTNYLTKTNDEIILFFDNVDDFEALNKIIDYKSINKPTILTSTSKMLNEKDFIEIKPFNSHDSKNYLLKKLPHLTDDDIDAIINHVGNQCKAYKVVQIASILYNNPSMTVSSLIEKVIDGIKQLFSNIEKKSNDAIKILKYSCFLNPDEIPDVLLNKIPINSNLDDVLKILSKYSLCNRINRNSPKVGISIHRISQEEIFNHGLYSKV